VLWGKIRSANLRHRLSNEHDKNGSEPDHKQSARRNTTHYFADGSHRPICGFLGRSLDHERSKATPMTRDQKIVAVGAASGVAAMVVAVTGIYQLWPAIPGLTDASSRLAYAAQASAFAVLPLLITVMTVGNNRFLSEAIDPTLQKEDLATQINGRVVENTLQQFVLFLVGITALSVNLTAEMMRVVPAAAIVFVIARLVFWIGYRIHPLYRAFGMAATGYLNVGILAFALWKALMAG
jgi:hypothetical protein